MSDYILLEGTSCAVDPVYRMPPPVPKKTVKLPEVKKYSREDFYEDVKNSKTKKEIISAFHKAMIGQHPYYSRMPRDVRNAIMRGMS